jgi:hypothetical protein
MTTIQTTIHTTIYTTIPTTIYKIPSTVLTTESETTSLIIKNCSYDTLINNCVFKNLTNGEVYSKLKEEILSTFPLNGNSVIVPGIKDSFFQVTNSKNEVASLNSASNNSVINLGECENILKKAYNIPNDASLVILKYQDLTGITPEKEIQYEVYHPFNYSKLDLSLCDNTTIEISIPIQLSEDIENLYNDLLGQGYDLFDPDDDFYRDLCTPYESENGTDVLLDDRITYYYNKVLNDTTCPQNCKYMSYSTETKYLKCECTTNATDIVTLDIDHISGKNVYKSFYSTIKYSNWKVMICYNLVFNFKIFCHNYGSILTLILFCIYVLFMIYYAFREISPLKLKVSKILFKESEEINDKFDKNETNLITKEKLNEKMKYPPKRKSVIKSKNYDNNEKKKIMEFIEDEKSDKKIKNKRKKSLKLNDNKNYKKKTKKNNNLHQNRKKIIGTEIDVKEIKTATSLFELKKNKSQENVLNKNLDNFELNNLDYEEASELDKRGFCSTYWSVLMREHSALLTFIAWHDYNLFYVKIERFLILFCTDMTMNGLFFSHESMHHLYVNNGEYSFIQQLPQILYSLIVSHILEVFLCYLSMTDASVYEIKSLPKNDNNENNGKKVVDILNKMKNKLTAFFIITFFLFLFYWYFISAFCAVYQNTQSIFLRDSITSFITSMIDPFLIYAITVILRIISLSYCCKKKCGCIYKISDLIPIF